MSQEVFTSPFDELRSLAKYTRTPERPEAGRDRLIRFLDHYTPAAAIDPIVNSLCIHFGLYPYLTPDHASFSTAEALAYEFHKPDVEVRDEEFVFHEDQATVFYRLLDGESIILSAPTSFGKSAILDAVVAAGRWNNIVVIVPTVALIDETRRRLVRFSSTYQLVTHPTQNPGTRNIFVLTQERFLELPQLPEVDFFMIDEFYKLGSRSAAEEQRMSMLNIAWRRLRDTGAQYYLTGPNVHALAEGLEGELRESLTVSKFRTVAVDIEDRSHVPDADRLSDMSDYWGQLEGSTLVFVSSPARAERNAVAISQFAGQRGPSMFGRQVADWIAESFHPAWRVVEALRSGVGAHTGPMPRSLQRVIIRLFAQSDISTLVCTSTLIEGVNTSAKTVVVYDKKINKKPIDFFTFSNVRGRAGRMSSHFLGQVVTYMPPPAEERLEVDIPIDSQPSDAPLSSIVQLPEGDLRDTSRDRLRGVTSQNELSLKVIKENRGFDPILQVEAARVLRGSRQLRERFGWSGYPNSSQARAVLGFGLQHLLSPRQRGPMTLDRMWGMINSVRDSQGSLSELVSQQLKFKFDSEDTSDVVARLLGFQRNWMVFTVPSLLRATQKIFNEVASSLGETVGNYEFYLAQVEGLFLEPGLLDLDEYGLPLPIAQRMSALGMSGGHDVSRLLRSFVSLARDSAVRRHFSPVELWIIDDVLDGLGDTQ